MSPLLSASLPANVELGQADLTAPISLSPVDCTALPATTNPAYKLALTPASISTDEAAIALPSASTPLDINPVALQFSAFASIAAFTADAATNTPSPADSLMGTAASQPLVLDASSAATRAKSKRNYRCSHSIYSRFRLSKPQSSSS